MKKFDNLTVWLIYTVHFCKHNREYLDKFSSMVPSFAMNGMSEDDIRRASGMVLYIYDPAAHKDGWTKPIKSNNKDKSFGELRKKYRQKKKKLEKELRETEEKYEIMKTSGGVLAGQTLKRKVDALKREIDDIKRKFSDI